MPLPAVHMNSIAARRLAPSVITLLALASGLTAVRFALLGRFEAAVLAVVLAAFLDVLDGRVAILFKATSRFGAELDSLADLISFGVAPGLVIYIWALQGQKFGWVAVLLFVLCGALRLARYNTLDATPAPAGSPRTKTTFLGVPTPSGAGLALMPLILSISLESDEIPQHPHLITAWLVVVGLLMVSRLPTPALKGWHVPAPFVLPLLLVIVLIFAGLFTMPFETLSVIGIVDFALLPTFWLLQRRQNKIQQI